ncbi:YhdP family protein [uncultured Thiohalocapsa sp.]|uniref:YhdP family protein n=1 Tax=uncultured Thiohalocapsa sp. TaxID=768990 RepID=UPI0025CEE6C6|nr:YhdP family protein [uncultured Thiohalocapsa sp.]
MTRMLRTLLRRLAGLAATAVIAFALLTLLLRLALPHADGLRGLVEERLGKVLGAELSVGALGLSLRGLQPELRLEDTVLSDPLSGERLLALAALNVDLDLRASLLALAPRIDGVTLVGARIEVQRGADGRVRVRGLDQLGGGDDGTATFFLREGHFSLADSHIYWTDSFAGVPTLDVRVSHLDLINQGATHRLRMQAAPPGDPAGELTLLADLRGPPGRPTSWSGRVYADWRGSDLARVLRGRLPGRLRIATDGVHVTAWAQLATGRPTRVTTRVWLDDLRLRRSTAAAPAATAADGADAAAPAHLDLGDVSALARWQRHGARWRLDVPQLGLFGSLLGGEALALRLSGGFGPGDGEPMGEPMQGRIAGLQLARLAEIARFAVPHALPGALREVLAGRIAGRLEALRFRLDLAGADADADHGDGNGTLGAADWLADGRISGLGIGPAPGNGETPAPAGPVPPLQGIDLTFSAAPDRGALGLSAAGAHLDLRPHLIAPLTLTRLAGLLQWHRTHDGIVIRSNALAADTPDVTTLSRLALHTLPGAPPVIDLHTHIRGGDAEAVPRYLPASKMDDRLEAWLDRAIVAGRLTSGDLLLRGPLGDFPFDAGNGWFRLELRVRDGVLDYQPPKPRPQGPGMSAATTPAAAAQPGRSTWPRLEDMDVTLRFDRRRLDIALAAARMLSTRVTAGSARMPNLWEPRHMHIEAEGTGPLTDGLAVLADTPLSRHLAGIPRALDASGDGRLRLALDVPLRRGLGFGYSGRLDFGTGAAVTLRDADLRLTDLAGALRFDAGGVQADGISARLGEQPLRVDIATRRPETAGAPGRTDVMVTGRTPVSRLAEALPSPWWALAAGSADWRLEASLSNADAAAERPPLDVALRSDLAGVALDLPAPFGKAEATERALRIDTRLTPGQPPNVTARLGDLGARLAFARDQQALAPRRIAVDLGRLPEALPEQPGIQVSGQLGAVDLGAWLAWAGAHGSLLSRAERSTQPQDLPLLPVRLRAESLRLGDLRLTAVRAALAKDTAGGWRIGLEADDNSASVVLPAGSDEPMVVRLDNLDLAPLLAARAERTGPMDVGPDPRRLPPLTLQIEALRRGSHALGRLHVALVRRPDGLAATELSLSGPLVTASGTGRWTRDATDYTDTSLEVDLRSRDLGQLLRDAGYYSALDGAPSQAALRLSWPGGPGSFRLPRARGTLDVDIGAGRLLDVEPGVGRMLGVLNLGALERRLSLDFSDVLDEGFTFDRIDGRLVIGTGTARISRFDILSSTADIQVRGSTDLVQQTFDQSVRVTPKIGTGVAIAGAVAGGPLVGAAVLLADRVSGNAVSALASYEYQITGPWTAPDVRRVAGSNGVRSVPDLLLPEATRSEATGAEQGAREPPPAPVSPFLNQD